MSSQSDPVDVAVVGGGAAGLMAALWAARAGARVVLLEGSRAPGLKILISGGGRCNILPSASDESDFYTSGSRHVLARLFRTWSLERVREFFEKELQIPLVLEEETGKLFPEWQRAVPVRDRLVEAVQQAGAQVLVPWRVEKLERSGEGFLLKSSEGAELRAARVILASGGASVPNTGSDGAGYEMARRLGHSLLAPYPALVPLTTADEELTGLAGIALPVRWRALLHGKVMEERVRELLFTHRGFSGPAVLDASHWAVRDRAVLEVAWGALAPEEWEEHWQSRGRREAAKGVGDLLPRRLAEILVRRARLREDYRIGDMTRAQRDVLLRVLCAFPLPVNGNEGFRVAEVTGGGIPIGEVNPSTLESRKTPGLYLCGEILDVIGRIGGYNFLWAWVTGRLAGESAARPLRAPVRA
ncbi:MAG: aminoacetone oxidase family FAD-binding enzyme [Planctomycetota bacterium]|nr:MAG: aminoacetone oxidase family FAD-binding enzyme [Planctomycetota bacterium]